MALRRIIAITLETILAMFLVASLFGVAYTSFRTNALELTRDDSPEDLDASLVAALDRAHENPMAYRVAK